MNITNPEWELQLLSDTGEQVGSMKVKRNRCNSVINQLWNRYTHVMKVRVNKLNKVTKIICRPELIQVI